MGSEANVVVVFYTSKKNNSGTNNTVYLILHSDDGKVSKPMGFNSFSRGRVNSFRLPPHNLEEFDRLVKIERIELWKGSTLGIFSSDWFVDKIVVENCATNLSFVFPVLRWIKSGPRYNFKLIDTSLPQFDEFPEQRKKELDEKKKLYEFHQRLPNGPAQVKIVPTQERLSFDYKWGVMKSFIKTTLVCKLSMKLSGNWESIEEIKNFFTTKIFEKPKTVDTWNSDIEFGRQRIASLNPTLVNLLKTIPEKFPITDDLVGPLMEGLTLNEAIEQKKLFMIDLHLLEGVPVRRGFVLCAPIALFYVNKAQQFLPIAIQLFQEPGPENPIFTPLDQPMTWTFVKMWYNCSDSHYHQAISHLCYSHLVMEGFVIATHRNLSPTHPVFKILAPHFLFIIPQNKEASILLWGDNSAAERNLNTGVDGLRVLTTSGWRNWRLEVNGFLPEDLKTRGVDEPGILPGYYFKDDALLTFNAINKYVTSYVELYYRSPEILTNDSEIQAWAEELAKKYIDGGAGYQGIPGNGKITCSDDLSKILSSIIYTFSVYHATVNFPAYDEYAFPPHYPTLMKGRPPTSKEANITEQDILDNVANKREMFSKWRSSKFVSTRETLTLGNFEVQYIFDPKALVVLETFRNDLKEISKKIKERNSQIPFPFEYLDPENIPNGISI